MTEWLLSVAVFGLLEDFAILLNCSAASNTNHGLIAKVKAASGSGRGLFIPDPNYFTVSATSILPRVALE